MQVQPYCERISGPFLDHIDIHLEVGSVTYHEMAGKELGESSEAMRNRVVQAEHVVEAIQYRTLDRWLKS